MCYLVPDISMEHGYEHSSYCPLYTIVEEVVESMQIPLYDDGLCMWHLVPIISMEHGYEHSSYYPLYSMVEEAVESMQNPKMMTDYV